MIARLRSLLLSLRERLWARPLAACVLSVMGVGLAGLLDGRWFMKHPPEVSADSIEALLSIMASSMLVIAIFAAGAMVSAYASASNTASPRSFPLVIADDVSQNAYSIFVGAFIFGVVGLVAVKNSSFETGGRFILFIETGFVFALVILTFVRWVDRIARLGRQGNTVDLVEHAAWCAIERRIRCPRLGGAPVTGLDGECHGIAPDQVGYVCEIRMSELQDCAHEHDLQLEVLALPGSFVTLGQPMLRVQGARPSGDVASALRGAFRVERAREFENDPRFGLIVLSEIADRALSPAVNDPGTAIDVIARMVRLFSRWHGEETPDEGPRYLRVQVPALDPADLVEDAFTAIARDGAGFIEVTCRLLKALRTLSQLGDPALADAACRQARQALAFAEQAMKLPEQRTRVRELAAFAE